MSGNTDTGIITQTSAIVKSFGQNERAKILKNMRVQVNIPPEQVASMKTTLNMPWYQLREVSRWLSTFNVKIASEKKVRATSKDWVGDGLLVEMAPLTKKASSGKRTEVILRPWAYLYNLVGHILKHLEDLNLSKQLFQHPFIP